MRNEYYGTATTPTQDFLAHYGVRGMKWGVRKAIQSGNVRQLSRQYKKAYKKLQKLSEKADIQAQKNSASKHGKRAAASLGVSLAGIGGLSALRSSAKKSVAEILKSAAEETTKMSTNGVPVNAPVITTARKKRILGEGKGIYKVGEGLGTGPVGDGRTSIPVAGKTSGVNGYKVLDRVSKAAAIGGLASAAYQTGRAAAAKYRTTSKGHAKAVAKRDAWKREMQSAFKGTKYSHRKK